MPVFTIFPCQTACFQSVKPEKPELRKTVHLKKVTSTEVLKKLSDEFRFNFFVDRYLQEMPVEDFDIENATLSEALEKWQNQFARNRYEWEGIFLFKHRSSGFMRMQEQNLLRSGMTWSKKISDHEVKRVKFSDNDDESLPARAISLSVDSISIEMLLRNLAKASSWRYSIDNEARTWRVSGQIASASPGRVTQALAMLIDMTPSVGLFRSKAQQAQIDYENDMRHPSEKDSEKLRPLLEKFLTQEEKQAIINQKVVSLPLDRLSGSALNEAKKYVASQIDSSQALKSMGISGLKNLCIVFLPMQQAPGGSLGVMGINKNGEEVWF